MKKWTTCLFSVSLALTLFCVGCVPSSGQSSSSESISDSFSSSSSQPGRLETLPVAVDEDGNPYHYEVKTAWSFLKTTSDAPVMRHTTDGDILFYFQSFMDDGTPLHNIYHLEDDQEAKPILNLPDKLELWTPNEDYYGRPAICGFDVDGEGNIYALYNFNNAGYWELDIYDKDGNIVRSGQRIQNRISATANRGSVEEFRCRDDKLYFLLSEKIQVTTLEGDLLPLPLDGRTLIRSMDFDENGYLYLVAADEVLKLEPANNFEILSRQKIPTSWGKLVAYSKESGKIFAGDESRIVSCRFDGNVYQTEMQFGKDISLTLSNFVSSVDNGLPAPGCLLTDGEDLLLSVSELSKSPGAEGRYFRDFHILRLKKTAGPSTEKEFDKILTITAAYRQNYLDEAVRLYQTSHPKIGIQWDALYNSREAYQPQSLEAGQKLAAKIMANDVGDIVASVNRGLDYQSILKTDAFLDLKDRIFQSQYYSGLNQNVVEAITIDGSIRALPVGTALNVMRYTNTFEPTLKVDNTITWSELLQIGLDHPERPLFGIRQVENYDLLDRFFEANMYDLVDFENKTVNLHEPWFVDLLEKLKAVYDQGNLTTGIPLKSDGMSDYSSRNYFFELLLLSGKYYSNFQDEYTEAEGGITVMPVPRGEKNSNRYAYASNLYSISSNSGQQDAAWDFLEFLLSYEAQTLRTLDAMPVNREAEQRQRTIYRGTFPEELGKQFDAVENEIEYLYDTGNYGAQTVPLLDDYLKGIKTLEDTLKEAEYNIWLLLNE